MTEPPLLFAAAQEKKKLSPLIVGIILLAVALVALTITVIILLEKDVPKFKEGRSVYQGLVRRGEAGFDSYTPYLRIIDAAGMVSENMLGAQQAVIVGQLVNQGNRVVDVVEIKGALYGADDRLIQEFIKTPLQPEFPLLPMEMRKFSMWVEPFPPEWLTGRIDVEINGYRIRKD